VLVTGVAAILVAVGNLNALAQVTDLALYLVFFAVNGAVIVLRFRQPALERPFRTPLAIGRLPLLPIGGILSVVVLATGLEPNAGAAGLVVCALGLAAGLVLDARSPLRRRLAGAGGSRA
jgi:APA family basic amino acid/polyamine antiporter